MSTREDAIDALFAFLIANGDYKTTGRRLIMWSQVKAQPALFLRHVRDDIPRRPTGLPPRGTIECEAWIYDNSGKDPDIPPEVSINYLLDALDAAIAVPPGREAQTLDGKVIHAWVEGSIDIHPGDLDGQAIAVVPIKMLVPNIG